MQSSRKASQTETQGQNTLRVLCVVRHPVGGIRTYLAYTYPRMIRRSFSFDLLFPAGQESGSLRKALGHLNVRFFEVARRWPVGALAIGVWRALRHRHFDVIHAQGLIAGVVTCAVNLWFRRPCVVTLHDVFPDKPRGLGERVRDAIAARVLRTATTVHFVTDNTRQNVLARLPSLSSGRAGLRTIMNGIPTDRFAKPDRDLKSEHRHRIRTVEGAYAFGFFGRFMPQKGFDTIIDAMALLRQQGLTPADVRVVAVGDGSYVREYRAQIGHQNLGEFFRFVGFIEDMASAYQGVDAILMPSRWEACGLVAMEALTAGKPLISTLSGGLKEVLAGTPALRIPTDDPAALATAMKTIVDRPGVFAERSSRYADEARRRFDVSSSAQETEEMLTSAAGFEIPSATAGERDFLRRAETPELVS